MNFIEYTNCKNNNCINEEKKIEEFVHYKRCAQTEGPGNNI